MPTIQECPSKLNLQNAAIGDPALHLEGAPNFRDFGGYKTSDGRSIRRGKLFRSESLGLLSVQDFERLAALGVRLVCDLRGEIERQHQPTRWPAGLCPAVVHMDINAELRMGNRELLDILRNDMSVQGAEAVMRESYRMIPSVSRLYLRDIFVRIADHGAVPLIIHCTSGKDRTGVLAALIQLALGVSREDILKDYLLTRHYQHLEQFKVNATEVLTLRLGFEPPREAVTAMVDVRESFLNSALLAVDHDYGSVENYLIAAGIDDALLSKVGERLLAA